MIRGVWGCSFELALGRHGDIALGQMHILANRRRNLVEINVKQRPQPTRIACCRADFSRPWRVETRPTQATHVSNFGVSLLYMVVRACMQARSAA